MTQSQIANWARTGQQAFEMGDDDVLHTVIARLDKVRGHKMLTKEVLARLPAIRTDGKSESMVQAKWFSPVSGWTCYATEFNPANGHAFGLVEGFETELGYFNVYELAVTFAGPACPMLIERDCYFTPVELSILTGESS